MPAGRGEASRQTVSEELKRRPGLAVGDAKRGTLAAIKRVSLGRKSKVKLEFEAPSEPGKAEYTLFFMCDSYMGCDQEYSVEMDVKEGEGGSDSGEDMDE